MILSYETFIHAVKEEAFTLRKCSICDASLVWFVKDEKLLFDSNCDCTRYYTGPEETTKEQFEFYLVPEHGHVERLQEFIEKHAR